MNYIEVIEVFSQFNKYTGLPGIVYFIFFLREWKTVSGILFYILLASFLGDNLGYIYAKYFYPNNYPILNAWHFGNFLLVAWLFYKMLEAKRRWVLISVIFFLVGSILTYLFQYSIWESNTFVWVSSNVFSIVFCLFAYLELLKKPSGPILKLPIFWVISSLLIFCSVTLLVFLFQQYLVFDLAITKEAFKIILLIITLSNTFKNLVIFYAMVLIDKGHQDSFNLGKV